MLEQYERLVYFLEWRGELEAVPFPLYSLEHFLLFARHVKAYDFARLWCHGMRVLDIGCFIGYGALRLSPHVQEVVAIDIDDDAIAYAQAPNLPANLRFEHADITNLPFADSSFGAVVAFELIEHIEPSVVGKTIREVRRVLSEDGRFIASTPDRKQRLMPGQKQFNPDHHREYTAKGFTKVLHEGFADVEITGIRAKPWIEAIENDRVGRSPFRAYMRNPAVGFIKRLLPDGTASRIKSGISGLRDSSLKTDRRTEENEFERALSDFSMDDFHVEKYGNSKGPPLGLFAVAGK